MAARLRQLRYRTDWFRVLADLQKAGLTLTQIAAAIEVPHSSLRAWGQGAEPAYEPGRLLVLLWCQTTGKTAEERPRTWG